MGMTVAAFAELPERQRFARIAYLMRDVSYIERIAALAESDAVTANAVATYTRSIRWNLANLTIPEIIARGDVTRARYAVQEIARIYRVAGAEAVHP